MMLKFIEREGLLLRSRMGDVELLVFPSKLLEDGSQSKFLVSLSLIERTSSSKSIIGFSIVGAFFLSCWKKNSFE